VYSNLILFLYNLPIKSESAATGQGSNPFIDKNNSFLIANTPSPYLFDLFPVKNRFRM
jgi:hypothetical protein